MIEPLVTIQLDGTGQTYHPGDILSGQCRLGSIEAEDIEAVELSVLWYTEGKGDEDLSVHLFKRFHANAPAAFDPRHPVRFSTQLPNSPVSYDGVVLKIHWCVRVRLFVQHGKEIVQEMPFRLGSVPAAEAVEP